MTETTSLSPKKSNKSTTSKVIKPIMMDFPDAVRAIMDGKKITKLEWNDPSFYFVLADGILKLHKPDDKFYNLIVSDGDLFGTDFIITS